MPHETIAIATADGRCPAEVFTPEGAGPWPPVLFFMDGMGIRPAVQAMAARLAQAGYLVLLPDLYYRAGPYPPVVPREVFATGDVRGAIGHLLGATDLGRAVADSAYFLDLLQARPDAAGGKVRVVGYCRSGAMALAVAGTYPDRIAAAASFHGGDLATDAATSPHRLAPQIAARVYVAVADQDPSCPPEMTARLEQALADASVDYRCETYTGAKHGWTMTDFPVYDDAAAERHWTNLLDLFGRAGA